MALRILFNRSAAILIPSFSKIPHVNKSKKPLLNFQLNFSSNKKSDGNKKSSKSFRHGYDKEVEDAVNHQILAELNASMVYLSMFCYYGRTDIALSGCQEFFKLMYEEEQGHAFEFIEYQLLRGGQVQLFPITVPEDMNWTDITVSLGVALELEKRVKDKLEELIKIAECHKDLHLVNFVGSKFIDEQVESIREMGRLLTQAKRLVDTGGVGRHLFDKEVLNFARDKQKKIK